MNTNADPSHEGELCKYANLLKGYQKRYFVIDKENGLLNYYSSGKVRHKAPKGSIPLKNCVLLPSEEDENLFTLHNFEKNIHKVSYLKAENPAERRIWLASLKLYQIKQNLQEQAEIKEEETQSSSNQCCICLDNSKQPVATLCGHLFCKSCINQWINLKPTSQTCPVCQTHINKNKLVRLYGINESHQNDPEASINDVPNVPDVPEFHNNNQTQPVLTENNQETQVHRRNLHEIQSEYLSNTRVENHRNQIEIFIRNILKTISGIFMIVPNVVLKLVASTQPQNPNTVGAFIGNLCNFLLTVMVICAILLIFFICLSFWISFKFGISVLLCLFLSLIYNRRSTGVNNRRMRRAN